jgi:hypothetical protein
VYQSPYLASQLANERQREMLAHAEQKRQARQVGALARASRRAVRAERRMRQALELRTELQR